MSQVDSTRVVVRAAAILTTSYVAGIILGAARPWPREYNQLELFVDFTLGSLTTAELKIEFSPYQGSSPTFYQETDETAAVSANVDTKAVNTVIHQFTLSGKYRLLIPIGGDEQIKISVKGTGTVTSSSMALDAILAKIYS